MLVAHLLQHLGFFHNLGVAERDTAELIFVVEAAVAAMVRAFVAQLQRNIELYRLAEAFLRDRTAQGRHTLQIGGRGRRGRYQGLEILYRHAALGGLPQRDFHIGGCLGGDFRPHLRPIILSDNFRKQHGLLI